MRASWGLAVLLGFVFATGELQAQGLLAGVRDDVKGTNAPSPPEQTGKSKKDKDSGLELDFNDEDSGITLDFTSLFSGDRTDWRMFPEYPYRHGISGYMQLDPGPEGLVSGHSAKELDLQPWSVRLSVENGNNFDNINRFNGTLQVETRCGLGLYTSWNYLYENLGFGYYDDLILGNITLTWRFLESRRVLLRGGVGAWIVTNGCGCFTDAGVNLHFSGDYFPMRPFVISGLLEGGTLGQTGILHTRASVGVLWRGLEFFGGYDFMQIGNTDLHTPMLGVRVWF